MLEVLVESGVRTGQCTAAGPLTVSAGVPGRAMTDRILETADQAGPRAALVDAAGGSVTAWPRFARTVRAAAGGLARRGLAGGDTAGVLVQDAASAAVAVNAIRAAGGAVCLIEADAGPEEVAARLNACGARLLITSAPLAELAAEAADRSRVRQVIAFGEAPGTTPFSSLLSFAEECAADESGRPKEGNGLADQHVLAPEGDEGPVSPACAADETGPRGARQLTHRDVVVAAPPCGDGQAYTSLLDLTLLTGATLVAAPVTLVAAATRVYRGTAAIVPRGIHVPGVLPELVFPVTS
jgi:acyl-CoA synthetase (AMP-forming)/AMP-acid ligase II